MQLTVIFTSIGIYWNNKDLACLSNIKTYTGPSVTLPNNTKIAPSKQGSLPLSKEFSELARTATNLPHLKSSSLLATGPLCDDGKVVLFYHKKVHVLQRTKQYDEFLDSSTVLLNGSRNHFDGCWDIPIAKVKM